MFIYTIFLIIYMSTILYNSFYNKTPKLCLKLFLKIFLYRSCAILRRICSISDKFFSSIGNCQYNMFILQSFWNILQWKVYDLTISFSCSGLNMTISSTRLRNSGLKLRLSSSITVSLSFLLSAVLLLVLSSRKWLPKFKVMMTIN